MSYGITLTLTSCNTRMPNSSTGKSTGERIMCRLQNKRILCRTSKKILLKLQCIHSSNNRTKNYRHNQILPSTCTNAKDFIRRQTSKCNWRPCHNTKVTTSTNIVVRSRNKDQWCNSKATRIAHTTITEWTIYKSDKTFSYKGQIKPLQE